MEDFNRRYVLKVFRDGAFEQVSMPKGEARKVKDMVSAVGGSSLEVKTDESLRTGEKTYFYADQIRKREDE